ncbi:aminopeptidase N [Spongorhabdus nitratireducens]
MKDARPRAINLKDYRQPDYWIDHTELRVELGEETTKVSSRLTMRLNDAHEHETQPDLMLVGAEQQLESITLDGKQLAADEYVLTSDSVRFAVDKPEFIVEIVSLIRPQDNTSLEGLYKSNTMYCTQCEAEGFRKITYYLDRPDVMSRFKTTVVADKKNYPVLLSNGNDIDRGDLDGGLHFVTWEDPFPKPSYLFALVAGDLQHVEDKFTTCSGRDVTLRMFVEPHNIDKCEHGIESLKKSMKWDEEVYGREYDLDIFMIVAVDDFNMGAMENKGLNIFNSSCVLARPDTATDATYQRIEAIVAHEYFHNWSGNRVTCRDWFQLSLKEGFTVFRDSEFSADMNSRAVKRIEDVSVLRSAQFAEDAGPMAHPIRPDSYIEINNFYTLTIYEKGAEVVRMIHNIVGPEGFRKGSDLYFDRHDGQAATCDDFVKAMEDANGVDLTRFKNWYSQAGTPVLKVSDNYDAEKQQYQLTISQSCPATPGQAEKKPFHIPFALGLIDPQGNDLSLDAAGSTTQVLHLKEAEETFVFDGIAEKPLPSLLRGFSAPVKVEYDYSRDDLMFLMSHDSDGFNRWDACQRLAVDVLLDQADKIRDGAEETIDGRLVEAFGKVLDDAELDAAVMAEMLRLPAESYLAEQVAEAWPQAIHAARDKARLALAETLQDKLRATYDRCKVEGEYRPHADDIAKRSLRNTCLGYLVLLDGEGVVLARDQYDSANNMTDQFAALATLVNGPGEKAQVQAKECLELFYQQWKHDANVMEQWFGVQSSSPELGTLDYIKSLLEHPDFDIKNPNKVRSVVGGFCMRNPAQFHREDGAAYQLLAELILKLNELNPQVASRMLTPLTRWKRFNETARTHMKSALESIKAGGNLSPDVFEVVSKSLV